METTQENTIPEKEFLTEKEAWIFIAKEFEKPAKEQDVYNDLGLCNALNMMLDNDLISDEIYNITKLKLLDYMREVKNSWYLWPCKLEYFPQRAALCRKFAEECSVTEEIDETKLEQLWNIL